MRGGAAKSDGVLSTQKKKLRCQEDVFLFEVGIYYFCLDKGRAESTVLTTIFFPPFVHRALNVVLLTRTHRTNKYGTLNISLPF